MGCSSLSLEPERTLPDRRSVRRDLLVEVAEHVCIRRGAASRESVGTCTSGVVQLRPVGGHVRIRGGATSHGRWAPVHPAWCSVPRPVGTCASVVVQRPTVGGHPCIRRGATCPRYVWARVHPRWCNVPRSVGTSVIRRGAASQGRWARVQAWCSLRAGRIAGATQRRRGRLLAQQFVHRRGDVSGASPSVAP